MNGLCECGCGERTNLAPNNNSAKGWIKGEPMRYVRGHHLRKSAVEYIADENGCWIWQRGKSPLGYGVGWADGKAQPAYRIVYRRYKGEIPAGHDLDHLCRVPSCVNPDHLEPVTHAENIRRGKNAKLTEGDVSEIRSAPRKYGIGPKLAEKFGVHIDTIYAIRSGKTWKALHNG